MSEDYDGSQVVGLDLHRNRTVMVRMTPDGASPTGGSRTTGSRCGDRGKDSFICRSPEWRKPVSDGWVRSWRDV